MAAPVADEDLQEAIYEFQQYLSDHKPPLMVADSVDVLLHYPADFVAAQIQAWVAAQRLEAPVSDYLYHGAKKIWHVAELDLLPKEAVASYLRRLAGELVTYCPEADRQLLRENLERLGQAIAQPVSGPGVLHRQGGDALGGGPATVAPAAEPHALSREVRRLSLLLERLRPISASMGAVPTAAAPMADQRVALASQFMTTAAVQAATPGELDSRLAPLRELGIDTATAEVFRTLARSIAGWMLPQIEGRQLPSVAAEQLSAMRRIVSLSDEPAESAQRFREMVHAAVEQFNEGHLGRASTMFDLAERLAAEQKVKAPFVEALRSQGHDYLDQERLRRYAERPDYRPLLRMILNFFKALQPDGLLRSLSDEPRREQRHLLLALLEAHGAAAREAAWQHLLASLEEGAAVDPYFQRNLVYLLRIIPRPESVSVDEEIDAVMRTCGRAAPPPLVKQAIAFLSSTRHEKAERALVTYLKVFENMLLQPDTAAYPPPEVEALLDRTCAALARYGNGRTWRLLIDHGLKSEARLGSPFLRLAEAGRVDLSSSRDLVERVIAAIRAELPRGGVLGLVGKKDEEKAFGLMQALASTPLPEVQELLQDIAARYGDRRLGEQAAKQLAGLASAGKPAPPPVTLSGDLELFGLPNLLHTIHQSGMSGVLSVVNQTGKTEGTLLFNQGEYRGGQAGTVMGEEAVYQLIEKPFPGTFAFVTRNDVMQHPRATEAKDVMGLLLEGVRRYDDFQRAVAVAPDTATFKATGKARTTPADEDPDFATYVWSQASTGHTPLETEISISTDSFRVRRLMAMWVEEGALQPV
jgi:hypothetical protein